MRIGRTETAGHVGSGANAGHAAGGEGTWTESAERAGERPGGGWVKAARGPWTVVSAVVAVVLGPAAVTASALDQANAAPMHHAPAHRTPAHHTPTHHTVRAEPARAYGPPDLARRGTAA
jgi:hypothetical protein